MQTHTPGPWMVTRDATPEYAYQSTIFPETDGDRIATAFGNEENARLIAAAPELLDALHSLRDIARYYHKGDAPGHLDACENPDNCGHCLAMRKVDAAIDKATG